MEMRHGRMRMTIMMINYNFTLLYIQLCITQCHYLFLYLFVAIKSNQIETGSESRLNWRNLETLEFMCGLMVHFFCPGKLGFPSSDWNTPEVGFLTKKVGGASPSPTSKSKMAGHQQ